MKAMIFIIAALLILSTASASDSNFLLTGDTLPTDGQLTYEDTTFVMQGDCNLVLYNGAGGFQSNTHEPGHPNCTLSLNNMGRLIITDSNNRIRYTSPSTSTMEGNYAAVLRPDRQVAVYGPVVWASPALPSEKNALNEANFNGNIPMVRNVLFSSQVMYDGEALKTRDYKLFMDADCNFKLVKAGTRVLFESKTEGKGKNCFLRLDHKGVLNVHDDEYKCLWRSGNGGAYGDYVLIMQINGQAVVYGPVVWSTSPSINMVNYGVLNKGMLE